MKRLYSYILASILIIPLLLGAWVGNQAFLSTGETVNSGITAVNLTDFTSTKIKIARETVYGNTFLIIITFTGDGSMDGADIDFYFQVSYDDGVTWTTDEIVIVDCPSDESADASYVVRHGEMINLYGVSHVRLWKIVNNDAANNITNANATIAW